MIRSSMCLLLVAVFLAALALTGCHTTNPSTDEGASISQSRQEIERELREKPFVIGVDDVIRVFVPLRADIPAQYEVSGDYLVGPEGVIFMPLLGDVQAAGLTKEELEKTLTEKLSEFIEKPEISVGISQYMSKKVYVIGEVALPGPVAMKGNILTVWDAIVSAGLPLKTAALWRVHVITPDEENPVTKRVNLRSIMYRGKFTHNEFLKPGDIVVVPSSTAASLGQYLGQIVTPASYSRDMAQIYDFFKNKSLYLDRNYGRFSL
jgi:polysaccharide export outer membrane protein